MNITRHLRSLLALAVLATLTARADPRPDDFTPEQVEFYEHTVRPILEESCLRCHGGTSSSGTQRIRGGLQLTSRRTILEGGDTGPAVDLANAASSLLLAMVSYRDEDHEMPPGGKLPQGEIEALTRWVEMGIPWSPSPDSESVEEDHEGERDLEKEIRRASRRYWAYQPVERPAVPRVRTPLWQDHPVDAFIARGLEAKELSPNPRASRQALIRRAFFDLTGLPPTPRDVESFVKDDSTDAWERLVDRLLESPHFGENWARHWLDLVRYAESNGYERDSDKAEIWRYRDYVIRAFNNDVSYDQFIREQLAGDELDEVTADSLIATGYHRLHLWDDEPVDRKQARYDNLDDIVRTTSEGFLGMTLGCARCHDHKKDPMRQRDYYSFMAFFSNITPMGKNNVFRSLDGLAVNLPSESVRNRRNKHRERLEGRMAEMEEVARQILRARGEDEATGPASPSVEPGEVLFADSRAKAQTWLYTTETPAADWMTNGFSPDTRRWNEGHGGFGRSGTPGAVVRTTWKEDEIWLRGQFRLTTIPESVELTIHHDEDAEVYLNGRLVASRRGYLKEYTTIPLDAGAIGALQTGKNILAVHCRQTGGGQFIDCGLQVGATVVKLGDLISRKGSEILSTEQLQEYEELCAELERVRAREAATEAAARGRAMCVAERGASAPPMHVHIRGNANAPGERVVPAFPAVLRPPSPVIPELPDGVESTGRRRALADWIASKENPLTARVLVNRIWQHYFGRAIVPTPNDFGQLGERPTHPELLDWLAAEFMAGGWKLKRMHRLLLLSRAYQMSSRVQECALKVDPENRLYWRNPMRRLTAEEIRDSILAVSGNLQTKMFGPSVFPELPSEVLATSSTGAGKWGRSSNEETARRSIYIKVKRSLLVPFLANFDFADTDAPCPVRFNSTVPTQALSMLNSKFVNDQAALFAERLREEFPGEPEAQIRRGLELVTCRRAKEMEVESCMEFLASLRREDALDEAEALDRFALLALNLNEFIYLD